MTSNRASHCLRPTSVPGEQTRAKMLDRISRGLAKDVPRRDIPQRLFRKHLGLPAEMEVDGSIANTESRIRRWYARHAVPWWSAGVKFIREITQSQVVLDNGVILKSARLAQGFRKVDASAVIVAGLSAGIEVDAEIGRLWRFDRPDEAMFLNAAAIACVEHLRSQIGKRFMERLSDLELAVLPHYSPGYEGWDLEDQSDLLGCLEDSGPIVSLPSGGLKPSKSTLAIFGVASRQLWWSDRWESFWDRFILEGAKRTSLVSGQTRRAYAFPERALEKWSRTRLSLDVLADDRIRAKFRLDGSTCSGMGVPLAFEYVVNLQRGSGADYSIENLGCEPSPGDRGHRSSCLYLSNSTAFQTALNETPPLQGWSLDAALEWDSDSNPSGCVCTRGSREHKWRIVLQTLHYALSGQDSCDVARFMWMSNKEIGIQNEADVTGSD